MSEWNPCPEMQRAARQGDPISNQSKKHSENHQSPQARGKMSYRRPRQIFARDIRELRGVITIVPVQDHVDGSGSFRISHVSKGGFIFWISPPISDVDRATAAAEILVAFVNTEVRR